MSWKRLFLTKKIIYRNEVLNGDEESMDKKGTAKEIIIESFKIVKVAWKYKYEDKESKIKCQRKIIF